MKRFMLLLSCLALVATAFAQNRQTLDVPAFTSLGIGVPAEVFLTKGSTYEVIIEAPQDIIDRIEKEVRNETLHLEFSKDRYRKLSEDIKVYVTMPTFESLNLGGRGSITAQTAFDDLGDVEFNIGGTGSIEMKGSAESAIINIGGKGEIQAEAFQVGDCEVNIGGSGKTYIYVTGDLQVAIAGKGQVRYAGSPSAVESNIVGSGTVQPISGE